MSEENDEKNYETNYNQYIRNMFELKIMFEITKCCGYTAFVSIYKEETILDLYNTIIHHFGNNICIKDLFFMTPQNERIKIDLSNQPIAEFVRKNITCVPVKLTPRYKLPHPVVYKLYLDDGHCDGKEHCLFTFTHK